MTQYYLSYRPRTECSMSQFFKTNCTQSIFRTINLGLLAKPFKKFQNHPYGQPVLISIIYSANCQCVRVFEWYLIELRFNVITNLLLLLLLFLSFNGFSYNDVYSYKVFDTRDIFEYFCKRCLWTMKTSGTNKRLKLQERLLTITKINIIRWNIYKDNNFHLRRQVLTCL